MVKKDLSLSTKLTILIFISTPVSLQNVDETFDRSLIVPGVPQSREEKVCVEGRPVSLRTSPCFTGCQRRGETPFTEG